MDLTRLQPRPFHGTIRISVCGAWFSLAHHWALDCRQRMIVTASVLRWLEVVPWFDQGACSSVPTWHRCGVAAGPCQIRRLRRDRSHAQPPLGGEHGEDPRFATARPRRHAGPGCRGACFSHGHSRAAAAPQRCCPDRVR
jgi:hypothetical protein